MSKFKTCKSEQEDPPAIGPLSENVYKGIGKQSFPLCPVINFNRSAVSLKLYMENLPKHYDDKMKKVNKQCLLDTPRTVRVREKTCQVIVQTSRL